MKTKLTSKQLKHLLVSVFFSTVLFLNINLSAQTENQLLGYQENVSNDFTEVNFFEAYEINTNDFRNGITVTDATIYTKPDSGSELANVVIPKGTNIKTYKLLVNEGFWAVDYKNNWGFVQLSSVMQVKDNQNALTMTKCDIPPQLRTGLNLRLPQIAKSPEMQDEMIFNILVDKKGKVKEFHLIEGDPELENNAKDVINKLKFKPGILNEKPIEVWMRYNVILER